ncbi:DUF2273 domain-containing protein [bacterium]|nr:DUF2273 domain-containing protein [bacterium]MBU2461712.1 DUF2273 domain-containing protein [bacterium]
MNNFLARMEEWMRSNPGPAVGLIIGLLIGLLVIVFGPVKTGIFFLCGIIGALIGRRLQ